MSPRQILFFGLLLGLVLLISDVDAGAGAGGGDDGGSGGQGGDGGNPIGIVGKWASGIIALCQKIIKELSGK